jgi:hypothetical protein
MRAVYTAALAAYGAGLCVLPPKEDGSKAPDAASWTRYQTTRTSQAEIDDWYAGGRRSGLGYVAGAVSGNLETLDFDDPDTYRTFVALARAAGLGDLVERIEAGYLEETPSGGRHWFYRCTEIAGNTKLASRPKRPEEMNHENDKTKTLIETRGEGGYIVAAPSNGRVHESGRPYRLLRGGVATIATITPEERRELFRVGRSLHELPCEESRETRTFSAGGGKPGSDYNARGDVLALLGRHGWQRLFERQGVTHLRRPGKDRGTSSTFGYGGTRYFFPFTTSTVFEAERAYSPFAVYATLEHDGDFSAAAKALAAEGYGSEATVGANSASWPTLDSAALHGLAGDVVRAIEPHTEGDPVALLVGFLVMFGSAIGPSPYARVGATKHRANENAITVGETARARKGTASNEVERIVAAAAADWKSRVQGGLSSGEGLIYAVRDPIWKPDKAGELKLTDPGVDDKRLLALEPEFSSVLRVAGRDGNTVSEVLRRAWDGNDLRTLTRGSPLSATGPHISLLGHVTKHELVRELSETYQANGFANRHLFVCVRRSKELPHGGSLPDADIAALVNRTRTALNWARRRGEIRRDAEANAVWEAVYSALTAERPGMFGAITARAEAHVLRLSLLYALLDCSEAIHRPHLHAALALWDYAEASARFIFGDATGDPTADAILAALRNTGKKTQTQISDLFSRNLKAGRLEAALALLLRLGKVRTWQGESTSGRPPTYWEAV